MAKKKAASILPHNDDAERAVLGSAMLTSDAVQNIISSLVEDDFFDASHQKIFRAILNLTERHIAIDILTVTEELSNLKELENIGGVSYLQRCADSMVAYANLEFYIDIVRDQSVLRKMLEAIRGIDKTYMEEEIEDVNSFIITAENIFKDSISRRKVSKFKTMDVVTEEVRKELETMAGRHSLDDEENLIGLTSGFPGINRYTQGFQREQLIVIAGRPGLGKTAIALNFAYKCSKFHDIPVAIFSLEMPATAIVRRLVAAEACVDGKRINAGILTNSEKTKVAAAIKEVSATKLFIDDSPGLTLTDIVAKSKKLQATYPDLGMIVIDYLGLVQIGGNSRKGDSRQEEVRKISLALKDLARELKIPVIVLSQLNRNVESRDSKKPLVSDLRDSGSIEQDADVIMLLFREDYYDKENRKGGKKNDQNEGGTETTEERLAHQPGGGSYIDVHIAKNRNGDTGHVPLFFFKAYGRFDTPPKDWEQRILTSTGEDLD